VDPADPDREPPGGRAPGSPGSAGGGFPFGFGLPGMGASGTGGGNPFDLSRMFADLSRLFAHPGAGWESAKLVAQQVASGNAPETNVDPVVRIRLEELAAVAELHVAGVSGLAVSDSRIRVRAVTPSEWATRSVDAYRPLLETLTGAMTSGLTGPGAFGIDLDEPGAADPFAAMLAPLMAALTPALTSMAAGSMVGHMAQRALGQYDLPVPRPPGDEILLVPASIDAFARDWSLPVDDVRLFVCLQELATHAVLRVPHVRAELDTRLREHAAGFRADPRALEERFSSLDLSDPAALGRLPGLGDPMALLGTFQSDAQRAVLPRLEAIVAVVVGAVDDCVDTVARHLLSDHQRLAEALRRRRVEDAAADAFTARLLGLSLGPGQVERAHRFVAGVRERAGDDGLARLWRSARELPTPAEIDAPGLWLARIDLPD
jgi:putative hydrolase